MTTLKSKFGIGLVTPKVPPFIGMPYTTVVPSTWTAQPCSHNALFHLKQALHTSSRYVNLKQRVPINIVHGKIADYLKSWSD